MSILDRIKFSTDDWIGLAIVVGAFGAMWLSGWLVGLWTKRRTEVIVDAEYLPFDDSQESMIRAVVDWQTDHPDELEASEQQNPVIHEAMQRIRPVSGQLM